MAELISRQILFGNPERAAARISPDGQFLSFLAPVDGVLNVWVGPVADVATAKPVTSDRVRGIRSYSWAYNGQHILYVQDAGGDENWHVYATDVAAQTTRDLTPLPNVQARILSVNEKTPDEVLVGLNDRVPQLHDVYRVSLSTGELVKVEENPGFVGYQIDHDNVLRLAVSYTESGGQVVVRRVNGEWQPFLEIGNEDALTTGVIAFEESGRGIYLADSRGRNTSGLFRLDLESGEQTLLAEDQSADIGRVLTHPTGKHAQAVSVTYAERRWICLDDSIQADLEFLRRELAGEYHVTSRTLDDQLWTIACILDDGPTKFYLYDRSERTCRYLFSNRRELESCELQKMHSKLIPSRDGLELVSYLTLPAATKGPGPMVLLVHGGPWTRDHWGFDTQHQWLANRGYAVLSVNYRGSTGFGKQFLNAANGEWSGKMHDDLLDAVQWAVDEGIADPEQVAIMGGSYGGYATLVGLTKTPQTFCCGVDIVGPSSLVTLLQNVPAYWMPVMPMMKDRVGDWTTEEGRAELLQKSPLTHVQNIRRPLLIGQGANDPRVKQVESDQIVAAMKENGIPVTYALFPDEGHGFARPQNRMAFYALTEIFLARYLDGRAEPEGEELGASSIEIKEEQ